MLVLFVGLVLTTVLVASLGRRAGSRVTAQLGSMSHSWLAAHQAAQHASSL